MFRRIRNFILKLPFSGIDSSLSSHDARFIQILNTLSLVFIIFTLPYLWIYLIFETGVHLAAELGILWNVLCYSGVILLNSRRKYFYAKMLFSFTGILQLGMMNVFEGRDSRIDLFFFGTMIAPFFIFNRNEKKYIFITVIIILTEYFIINHSGMITPWILFTPESVRMLNILNEAVVFAVIILEGVYFYKSLLLAEEKAETEQKKSDSLLLNILPEEVASELKLNGKTVPRHIPNAVIVFTDFAGFTLLSEKMSAEELIMELDFCFTEFDSIIKKYKLEKLKTIGDAYMFAGGLLHTGTDFSFRCVSASLEIRDFILNRKNEMSSLGKSYWDIRIGIHKGPVAAGVIGKSKFSFDVWGDTVNTASRLESSGVPGKVNISESVKTDVSELFNLEYRGEIYAKSKGNLPMYFAEQFEKISLQSDGGMIQ